MHEIADPTKNWAATARNTEKKRSSTVLGQKSREQPKDEDIYGGKRNVFSLLRKDENDVQLRRAYGREFQIVGAA